ncbi:class I SAM-dependent methyltransferase [Nonomuraea muscovyensis]|uniref:SAM-dependent methyltransferase n=1 Tax=Nonomuraea muscovyensis TaxID=1124761 RepID=A0A7X0C1Y8_9ACTN|nr:class I SAM-dependent methyltransferase [Nonomuraea muscovyensis]MBB6346948.1 SAM-dependent methyltransferase [Nonomuraea muscovyensis]MDF2704934.1 Methyltransferase type 11 [Nonomuraea muscovyensis]
MTDPRFTAEFWDQRYASAARVWSGNPNAALVEQAAALPPGTALDAGCGEGADALWLAGRGWRVTAIDVSATALRRAAAHAGPELAGRLTWRRADLMSEPPEVPDAEDGRPGYDLVVAAFMHFPSEPRRRAYAALASAVAPGGSLLIIGHHLSDLDVVPRPFEPDLFFTPDELAGDLEPEAWTVHTCATRPRAGTDPDGRPVTLHDTVLRARRRD